jgi:hypothetical protein
VRDERVRERRRLRDVVGGERDDRRRLEDADAGRCGRQQVREARRGHDEEPGHRREAEVEAEHQQPEREPEHDPGEHRQGEGEQPEPRAAQRNHPLREVAHGGLDPRGRQERQAGKGDQDEAHRALAVDAEDDDRRDDGQCEHDREGARGADPRDLGEPRQRDEEEQEEGEDVEDALEDDGSGRLHPGRASEGAKGDDPGGVPRTEREHAVQELAEEEGLRRRPDTRSGLRREHVAPAEHTDEETGREQPQGREQVPVVAVAERAGELGELDVPDGEIAEPERERHGESRPGPARPPPRGNRAHRAPSPAMQARL